MKYVEKCCTGFSRKYQFILTPFLHQNDIEHQKWRGIIKAEKFEKTSVLGEYMKLRVDLPTLGRPTIPNFIYVNSPLTAHNFTHYIASFS